MPRASATAPTTASARPSAPRASPSSTSRACSTTTWAPRGASVLPGRRRDKARMRDGSGLPRVRGPVAVLVLVTLLLRLPFLSRFDFVSFDGTYYIGHGSV